MLPMPLSTASLMKTLRHAVKAGTVRYTEHAQRQMRKRDFTVPDAERCLRNGYHDFAKDEDKGGTWRYRIQGTTVDGKSIKLAVALEEDVIVVTVID